MLKVLVAALLGTIIGIIVMVVVIAISGTDTSGASSVGLSVPLSTYTPSTSTASTPTSSGGSTGGGNSTGGSTGDANAGKAVFASAGCAGCHTLSQAGASGTIGPNLNTAIKGDAGSTPLPQFIKDSIVNPDAVIAKGYSAGIMPTSFGSSLSSTDINNLVALIMSGQ